MVHVLFKPKPKVKVATSKPQPEPESPQITIRVKKKKPKKKKGKRCLDCIDSEIIRDESGFSVKPLVYCHSWNTVVRVSMAQLCPHFCPKTKRGRR